MSVRSIYTCDWCATEIDEKKGGLHPWDKGEEICDECLSIVRQAQDRVRKERQALRGKFK